MIRYLKNSIENMRDIGGYKTNLGNKVKVGKLIRSNLPEQLSINDICFLYNMKINTVIDLRTRKEVIHKKSIFEDNSNFKIYHVEMNIGNDIPQTEELVPKYYIDMLTLNLEIKKIFEILNDNERVLYFCNAGKDRTGIITVLIQKLLGVSESDIIKDYLITEKLMKDKLNVYANYNSKILNIITPKKMYMETFLNDFKKKYYNIEEYLKLIGVQDKIIENIRNKNID